MLLKRNDLRHYAPADEAAEPSTASFPPFPGVRSQPDFRFLVGRHQVDLNELVGGIDHNETILILTAGHWSLHEMIDYISSLVGTADMWLTTWGITAEPLKCLLRMGEQGRIRDLTMLFDSRVRTQCPEAYQLALASKNPRIYYGKNHSKMAVLRNKEWAVTISSSANLTQNPRIESYVIITHRPTADAAIDIIEQIVQRAEPFEAK